MNLLTTTTLLLAVFFVGTSWSLQTELLPYNPVPNPSSVVISGNARFTVLTPRLIRIEYSSKGKFEDRATMAFVNRQLPRPTFSQAVTKGILQINTTYLTLNYQVGQPFSAASLTITPRSGAPTFQNWAYGQKSRGNLLGTIKSLDELDIISLNCTENQNVIVHNEQLHCEWGLVSREGWAVVDDSKNWALNSDFWWVEHNIDEVDLYFFGHADSYKDALTDYVSVGGKIAMVPRNALGIWWSRWYNLNNFDVMQIVSTYESHGIPLDVFILDMDWHTKQAWGGYTVDQRLFPVPSATFSWLLDKGLILGANLHDDDGVHNYEQMYPQMARAMGIDPATKKDIAFQVVNQTYMYSLEDIVLGDVENQGMTFWWIDWQQGGTQGGAEGGKQNPTIGLNKVRSTDHIRRNEPERGLILARWGGLGTHRYQVGFSGDVRTVNWQNLAFQPYFSFTSSNVAYGFWSHDLVGPAVDHELHTRWIQWGAYSGIFRTHDRGMAVGSCIDTTNGCPIIEIWKTPSIYFEAMREAMVAREELIPYIYTALRQAYDTGVSLLRPMYYEYPKFDNAYKGDQTGKFGQYFFGDDMFVAPITSPALSNTSMATATIWIPPGTWIEKETGFLHNGAADGSTILKKSFSLSEIPVFVRAGAIIPGIPVHIGDTVGLAIRQFTTLVLTIYPGTSSGATTFYEDDGTTTDYLREAFKWTPVSFQRTSTDLTLTIDVPTGKGYPTFPNSRNYIIRLVNSLPVVSATVNGASITYSRFGGPNTWHYDGPRVTTIIETASLSTASRVVVTVKTTPIDDKALSGIRGRLQHSILAKQLLDLSNDTPGSFSVSGGALDRAAAAGELLSYYAGKDATSFFSILSNYPALFQEAVAEVDSIRPVPQSALIQLWYADRNDNCLCGTTDCYNANNYYQRLRVEGYQPLPGTPGTVRLNDFWNPVWTDNYATTASSAPQGYTAADFSDGYVYATQQPGTVPVSVYWSEARKDMLTVASAEGRDYARQFGYQLVNATVGYVLTSPPEGDKAHYGLSPTRWANAAELLASANN